MQTVRFNHPWVDERDPQVLQNRFPTTVSDDELKVNMDRLDAWVREANYTYAWVIHIPQFTAAQRIVVATAQKKRLEFDKRNCACYSFVAPSQLLRSFLAAIFLFSPAPVPQKAFSTEEEAVAWAKKMLAEKNGNKEQSVSRVG